MRPQVSQAPRSGPMTRTRAEAEISEVASDSDDANLASVPMDPTKCQKMVKKGNIAEQCKKNISEDSGHLRYCFIHLKSHRENSRETSETAAPPASAAAAAAAGSAKRRAPNQQSQQTTLTTMFHSAGEAPPQHLTIRPSSAGSGPSAGSAIPSQVEISSGEQGPQRKRLKQTGRS